MNSIKTLVGLFYVHFSSPAHPYCKAFFRWQQVPTKEKIPGKRVSFDISDVIYFLLNNVVVVQKWKRKAEKGGHGILH